MHGHEQNDSVSCDVGDLKSVVELGQIHASTGQFGMPQLLRGNAGKAASENATGGPQNNNHGHHVDTGLHLLRGEDPAVEHENGQFDRSDAASVKDGPGEQCLSKYQSICDWRCD